ncbi:DNL-type zinc finger protein [Aspergillus lucknowensis]|uniref:DNL zinc finger-domain-containing protein n=1 Tax=Aspergillus lucknowensis TaxID=176173 RepID=A0ABR4M342_9EURO
MQRTLRLCRGFQALHSPIPQPYLSRGAPSRLYSQLTRLSPRPSPSSVFHQHSRIRSAPSIAVRYNSNSSGPKPLTDQPSDAERDAANEQQNQTRREQEPAYMLTFTCKPCGERSSHRVSKHGYHRGTVLIQCPSCSNRHIISDHLGIFLDQSKTLEDILEENGQKMTHGSIDGDFEFRDDELFAKMLNETERLPGTGKEEPV